MYVPFRQPRRGGNNLEYYVNGVRVTRQQYAAWLSQCYGMPPNKAIEQRVRDAKQLMRANGCSSWRFPDGSFIKY